MTTLTILSDYSRHNQVDIPADLADEITAAIRASKRPNTLKAYQSDLALFTAWCRQRNWSPLPADPETVAAYLVDQRKSHKLSTLRRHLATLSKAHQIAGLPNPCTTPVVVEVLKGLRNQYPQAPTRAAAMSPDHLRTVLAGIKGSELSSLRDRAVLLTGWAAALRRSEIAALKWADIDYQPDGVVLTILGSKTDKAGTGQQAPLAAEPKAPKVCPVKALQAWQAACLAVSPLLTQPDQPVFRQVNRHSQLGAGLTGHAINQIISARGTAVGLSGFTGHSLRRGLAQTAHAAGVGDSSIMQTTRHRSVTQLRTYQGDAGLLTRAASKGLLL
jgi:integrase